MKFDNEVIPTDYNSAEVIAAILGNAFVIFTLMKPTYRLEDDKKTSIYVRQFNVLAFLLGAWYASPWISIENVPFLGMNLSCASIEFANILWYIIMHVPAKEKCTLTLTGTTVAATVLVIVDILVSLVVLEGKHKRIFCAWLFALSSGAMFVIPLLEMMWTLFKEQSLEVMPIIDSILILPSSACWFYYGLSREDLFTWVPNAIWFGTGIVLICINCVKLVRKYKQTNARSETILDIRNRITVLKNQTPNMILDNVHPLNAEIERMYQLRDSELFIVGMTEIMRLSAEYMRAQDAQNEVAFNHALTLNSQDQNLRLNTAHNNNILKYLRTEIGRGTEACETLRAEKVDKQDRMRTFKKRVTVIEDELDGLQTHIKNLNRSLEKMSKYTRGLQNDIALPQLHSPDFQSRKQNYLDWLKNKKTNVLKILEKKYL